MKIACLTILSASIFSVSAAPFSFISNVDEPSGCGCGHLEETVRTCAVGIGKDATGEGCFQTCLGEPDDCAPGCALVKTCATQCVPGCESELIAAINCQMNMYGFECQCASFAGSFALKLANTLKEKKNLRA